MELLVIAPTLDKKKGECLATWSGGEESEVAIEAVLKIFKKKNYE